MAANIKDEGIADEVVDQLLVGRDPATVFERGGLIDELKKRLAERMLNVALDQAAGPLADGDTAGGRGILHTFGQVDGVADGRVLGMPPGLHRAHYDFAGVDADADLDAVATSRPEF